ncbi:MAG: peptidase T [Bacteroidales bacterium]|nr:peptidase T [Bacteroidales bacterium]
MKKVKYKFLKYIKFDTQSNPDSNTTPSTVKQFDLAKEIQNELEALELKNIKLTDKCYLYATLPANTDKKVPAIGFIAHLDTAPDTSGEGVNPQVIENYNGKDIELNKEKNIILSPNDFPELKKYIGQTLITTDGKTLLGADDKAGVASIITAIEYLQNNPEILHGDIKIAFTPDEEIGRGADNFDVDFFNAEFAYTVDGGELGELEYENFNAASLEVIVTGRNVHPGTAKNQMINSINVAHEFHAMLPHIKRPEHTTSYEGFYHLTNITGTIDETKLNYIIRDHDRNKFEEMKEHVKHVAELLNKSHHKELISVEVKDSYYNMREKIEPVMYIVDIAKEAMKKAGITPIIKPIRGGTDGAKLSYVGLPCPNIFTGGHNFHGKYEYISLQSMMKTVETIVNIAKIVHDK